MRNIWAIARGTMKEAVRRRSMAITLILSLLFICGVGAITQQGLRHREGEDIDPLLTFQILGTIRTVSFFGALLTLFITMNAIPLEIERRTIYTMLSKPLERYQFILGKFIGCFLLLAVNLLVMAVVGALFILSHDRTVALDLIRSFGILTVRLTALCSLIVLFTTFMPATGGAFLALGIYFLGQAPGGFRQVAEAEGLNPILRIIARILYPIVSVITPRVNKLNFDAPILESPDQLQAIIMVLGYSGICLIIAMIIFGRKEL
ncbi:MAG: ABC transporter permease [Armatimonadetes bacterium]|nr:ABC transporter permease [Armatimonadota bacterium]